MWQRRDDSVREVRPAYRSRRPPRRREPRRSTDSPVLPFVVPSRLPREVSKRAALYCRCGRVSWRDGQWKKPCDSLERLIDWCVEHNIKHFELRLITCPECVVLGKE